MQLYAYGKKLSVSESASISTIQGLIKCVSDSATITPELLHELALMNAVLAPAIGSTISPATKASAVRNPEHDFGMGLAVGMII